MQTNKKPEKAAKTVTRGGLTAHCEEVNDGLFRIEVPRDISDEVIKKGATMVKEKHSAIRRARPRKGKGLVIVTLKRKCSLKSHPKLMVSVAINLLSHINGHVSVYGSQSVSSRKDEAPQRLINQPQPVPVTT